MVSLGDHRIIQEGQAIRYSRRRDEYHDASRHPLGDVHGAEVYTPSAFIWPLHVERLIYRSYESRPSASVETLVDRRRVGHEVLSEADSGVFAAHVTKNPRSKTWTKLKITSPF